jgi:Ni2+-binding GTPase involved in maturation of urease and hydrogenase
MKTDALMMRKGRPFVMANMKTGDGLGAIIAFLRLRGGLDQIDPSEEWR